VHAAVLAGVDEPDRRRLHRIIARALESREAGERYDAEIARHWFEAGDGARAAAAYARAADASLRVYARDEAAHLATLGLACADDPELQCTLLKIRINANRRRLPIEVVRADTARLRESAEALGDEARFNAARLAFEIELGTPDLEPRSAAVDAMRGLVDDIRFPLRGAFVAEAEARNEGLRGNYDAALARAEAAMNAYAACAATREQLAMANIIVRLKSQQGRIDEADALAGTIEPSVTALNDPALTMDYWYGRAFLFSVQRNGKANLETSRRVIELARAFGDRLMEAHATNSRAMAYQHLSELGNALRDVDAALELYEAIGVADYTPLIRNNRASMLLQVGRIDEAAAILSDLYASSKERSTADTICFAANNLGSAMFLTGRIEEALDLHREAYALAREMGSEGFAALLLGDLGEVEIACGDPSSGLGHLREAIAINRKLDRTALFAYDLSRAAGAEPSAADGATHARTALAIVESGGTDGIAYAPEIYGRCAAAFARAKDEGAALYCRERGRALLALRLALIDESDRASYRALPWHAALLDDTADVAVKTVR